MSEAKASTINYPRNDDLRIERDRLVTLLENTHLDQKQYRKVVESVQKTIHVIVKLKSS
jgi:hypothetical protein